MPLDILQVWAVAAVALSLFAIHLVRSHYARGIDRFNGPFLASLTDAWRMYYYYSNQKVPFQELHEHYGEVVRIGPKALSFSSPQAIPQIFGPGKNWQKNVDSKSGVYFANMGVVKGKLAPTLFSSTDIGYHKSVRKAVNPFFTLSRVATYEPFVEKTIATFMREMHTRFANRQGPSGSVDIHTWLSFYTFDSISELTYSKPHGFMKHGGDMYGIIEWVADFLKYGFIVGQMPSLDRLLRHNPLLMWLARRGILEGSTFPGAKFALGRLQERKVTKSEEKPNEEGPRQDLLDSFLRAKDEKSDVFTDREVLGSSLSMLIAGAETTAITMTAILYYILRTPGCRPKLEAELFERLPTSTPDTDAKYLSTPFSDAYKLPYLYACVQEAFRMYPAQGMMTGRIVPPSGATICDRFIPGGTLVGINAWTVQRDKTVFRQDAESYRPERWLEDDERRHQMEKAMFNFGAGNHVCLGQNIARMNIFKLIPSLFRAFEVLMENPDQEWRIVNGANMKQTNFSIRLRSRSTSDKG